MAAENVSRIKITKTETEYDMKSIKFLLLTISTMFIVTAGLMIVLGLSVYSRYHSISFLYESVKSGNFFTPSIMVVILGMAMLVVSLFGFFGSLKESTCLVNSYALVLMVVLIVELSVVCICFTMDTAKILSFIDIPVESYTTDPEIQAEIDILQKRLNCCGRASYHDYMGLEFTANHSTLVATREENGDVLSIVLPMSCCSGYSDAICTRVRSNSCQNALANVVVQNSSILGVLGVSVMFIQVLGITFALLLARCIRKYKSERALLRWQFQEDIIMARQATEKENQLPAVIHVEEPQCSNA